MAALAWMDGFLTGLDGMDKDHRHIFALLGDIRDAAESGESACAVVFLDDLTAFVEGHFQDEERLMNAYAYPRRETHAAEHRLIMGELRGLLYAARRDPSLLSGKEELDRLIRCLTDHMVRGDLAYKSFFEHKGIVAHDFGFHRSWR